MLQQYFRALADFSVRVKKYQQAFLAPLPGMSLTTSFLVIALRNVNKISGDVAGERLL